MRANLVTLLDAFRRHSGETAVVRYRGNRRLAATYGEIAHLAGRVAAMLEQRGLRPGERVLLWAENSAEWIAAFYGCMLRGVLVVPLDAYGTPEFARRVCKDVRPSLILGDTLLLRRLDSDQPQLTVPQITVPQLTVPKLAFEDWSAQLPPQELGPIDGLTLDTPLQILFTSGTTGDPKGIVHTHGNVLSSITPIEDGARRYMKYERLVHPLRFLHTLPLSHVFGQMMGLWVPPIFAAEVHFENRLAAPRLIELIRKERISVLAAVPRLLSVLRTQLEISHPTLLARLDLPKTKNPIVSWWRFRDIHAEFGLKFWALISGGVALPPALEQFWNTIGLVLIQGYGMTETTALITLNHPFHVAQGSIGKPLPGRELKLGPDGELLVRGPMVAKATWSNGAMHTRSDDWLPTGDLAETEQSGDLHFLGRKSEVIVTAAGVNLYPEDLEAAIEQEPGVRACAVVPVQTPGGQEPCAVLAFRGTPQQASAVIERANARLADYQHIIRWSLWPEPDLPRTSTGKVRRKSVAAWLAAQHGNNSVGKNHSPENHAVDNDWLLSLIAQISGEETASATDDMRLTEDLHLDSLGRVQLAAAIEERTGAVPANEDFDALHTLGDLRRWIAAGPEEEAAPETTPSAPNENHSAVATVTASITTPTASVSPVASAAPITPAAPATPAAPKYVYPRWPWWAPVRWLRVAFQELIMRPLVAVLAAPAISRPPALPAAGPMLIIANHVSTFDAPLLLHALPWRIRRRIAVAMSGEMLDDYRHFRDADRTTVRAPFFPTGPLIYWLLTALFNVFPLPQRRDFQRSFAHAGEALDHGYNVLVFPEGTRSADGTLAAFRAGIGLLVRESNAPVLPIATRGLGALKVQQRGWFRSGTLQVRVGEPIVFPPEATEAAITARLHDEIEKLMR